LALPLASSERLRSVVMADVAGELRYTVVNG
jgi:hypothetical protein